MPRPISVRCSWYTSNAIMFKVVIILCSEHGLASRLDWSQTEGNGSVRPHVAASFANITSSRASLSSASVIDEAHRSRPIHKPNVGKSVMRQENKIGYVVGVLVLSHLVVQSIIYCCRIFFSRYTKLEHHIYAYKFISFNVSALAALMFEKLLDKMLLLKGLLWPLLGVTCAYDDLWKCCPSILIFLSLDKICFMYRKDPDKLFAVENIAGHLAAFFAIEAWHERLEVFTIRNKSEHMRLLFFFAAPFLSIIFFYTMHKFSLWFLAEQQAHTETEVHDASGTASDSQGSEETAAEAEASCAPACPEVCAETSEKTPVVAEVVPKAHGHGHEGHWKHIASHARVEASALVFGFLVKEFGKMVMYVLYGQGKLGEHCFGDVVIMFTMTATILVVYIAFVHFQDSIRSWIGKGLYSSTETHICFALSWCFATVAKWWTYSWLATDDKDSALKSLTLRKLIDAVWLVPLMAGCTVVVAMMKRASRTKQEGVVVCCGIISGIALEQMYASSIRTVARECPIKQELAEVLIGFTMLVCSLPVWYTYVVPIARLPLPKD
eukprot:TRINITY_DN2181_c0_g1_i3.p1 TRINITY_DN2181_c0_g1~~TRINITY_DN2181_c0_g1_i3.p1  ORF type:complete len:552 (-),score=48.73 TRINITY_DN2181_c0_g1_i3:151-1806(-)